MLDVGRGEGVEEARDPHPARPGDAAEVVAHQVDDHHVLGAVLGADRQGVGHPEGGGALDRRAAGDAGAQAHQQLGRGRDDRARRQAEVGAAGGGPAALQTRRGERERGLVPGGRQALGEVDLVAVARPDQLARGRDGPA